MGKAVPRGIKTKAEQLVSRFPDQFSEDYEKNKKFLDSLALGFLKSTRNLIAGYAVNVVKKKKKR